MKKQQSCPIQRGDIYCADLTPVVGSEQGGFRPVLILQNNIGNEHSPTVIAAAITGCFKNWWMPTHVLLPADCGLRRDSIVMLEQLRTLDKTRLMAYIGCVSAEKMNEVNKALEISMGLTDT